MSIAGLATFCDGRAADVVQRDEVCAHRHGQLFGGDHERSGPARVVLDHPDRHARQHTTIDFALGRLYSRIGFDMPRKDGARPLHGTLDLLVLKSLSTDPRHGVGVMQRIEQMTSGTVRVSYGSLFPALHRMEERGWLTAEWRASETNRQAKYYKLTAAGRRQLRSEEQEWGRLVEAVMGALRSS
jgi:transcriptional regulator